MENIEKTISDFLNKWFSSNEIVLSEVLTRNVDYRTIRLALDYDVIKDDGGMYSITNLGKCVQNGDAIWDSTAFVCKPEVIESVINTIDDNAIYQFEGARGRNLTVYEDKCVLTTTVTVGSVLTGNMLDGQKTIYYVDCIGVQFKRSGMTLGYLQLETAGSIMNNRSNNFFNENTFTFDSAYTDAVELEKAYHYIENRIAECKKAKSTSAPAPISGADEIKKFKELLDLGIITQEEFDAKKKQLLGL